MRTALTAVLLVTAASTAAVPLAVGCLAAALIVQTIQPTN